MHANYNVEIIYIRLMISLPFAKFPEHHSAKITYLRSSVYVCEGDEDNLLIARMMPVGRADWEWNSDGWTQRTMMLIISM